MATITKQEAVEKLAAAAEAAEIYNLTAYYNELFPFEPVKPDAVEADRQSHLAKMRSYLENGVEIDEIIDLWNVIFSQNRSVWFDEEEGLLHYKRKKPSPAPAI